MASGISSGLNCKKEKSLTDVTKGTNSFALKLFEELCKRNFADNVFVSPISVQLVMTLAYLGAGGETAKEIADVLMLPGDNESLTDGYQALITALKNPVLSIATKMFVENNFSVKEDFNETVKKIFETEVLNVDFQNNSQGSKNIINAWVKEKTKGKIQDLIADGVLTSETVMVLVNAIHFKANWKNPFSVGATTPDEFYITEKDSVEVQMMGITSKFGYAVDNVLDAKILELPYEHNEFSMYIILPNKINGLSLLIESIKKVNIEDLLNSPVLQEVHVKIPKFEISHTSRLNDVLKDMGVKKMFDSAADFKGITDQPISVSEVIQKAFIKVDEKGTEAAAATVMEISNRSLSFNKRFIANHPFLFIIGYNFKSHSKKSILFMGKYNNAS